MQKSPGVRNKRVPESGLGLLSFILIVCLIIAALGGVYWFNQQAPKSTAQDQRDTQTVEDKPASAGFNETIDLPSSPAGLAWTGQGFIAANKTDPFGFIYIGLGDTGAVEVQIIPVIENRSKQNLAFPGITWNGNNYISMASRSSALKNREDVFTVHDPADLSIKQVTRAPEDLGCITWDGAHYWAGTRKEINTTGQSGFLYKLDTEFKVVSKTAVSMNGCNGIVWDGYRIIWADTISDSLHLIDVSAEPKVVHAYKTSIGNLAGLAYDENYLWIADSGKNQIRRLDPRLQQQWLIGDYSVTDATQLKELDSANSPQGEEAEMMALIRPLTRGALSAAEVQEFVESLVVANGYAEAKKIIKFAIPRVYDKNVSQELRKHYERLREYGGFSYTDDRPLAEEAIQFSYLDVRVEGGSLVGSWQVVVGEAIVAGLDSPAPDGESKPLERYIRYKIQVKSESSSEPYERDFEITSDTDIQEDYVLLEELEKGSYIVRATMNAQYYVDGNGRNYSSSVSPHIVRY